MYKALLNTVGFEQAPEGHFTCPFCGVVYKPTYSSKEEAMKTDDLIAREQWTSHLCRQECWDKVHGKPKPKQYKEHYPSGLPPF